MSKHVMRLTACSALLAATAFAGSAFAGQELYVATVCDDTGAPGNATGSCAGTSTLGIRTSTATTPSALEDFYLSAKEYQFTHPNTDPAYDAVVTIPTFALGETFSATSSTAKEDPCDVVDNEDYVNNLTALINKGRAGNYNWTIVLPKYAESGINLQLQCAVLKPNESDIVNCAGEEGEKQDVGNCTQAQPVPGQSPLSIAGLPVITATAYPGYYARSFLNWAPFKLTAYKVPSSFAFAGQPLTNTGSMQALDGSSDTRMPLKACVTENIYIKQPVAGQVNAAGETEQDLVEGDYVVVKMDLKRGHTMDVYCHAQSARVAGIGDPFTLLP